MRGRAKRFGRLGRTDRCVALDGHPTGLLDGPQPSGHPGLAGGDGLAVASAVGSFGQALAESLDLAEVGFSLVGVGGDGEDGDAGGVSVKDKGDHLGVGVPAGRGQDPGAVGLGPGLLGDGEPSPDPFVKVCEYHVGSVDLVAGGGEVPADRAELGAPVVAVFQEPGGLRLVQMGAGAGVFAQLGLEIRVDRSGLDETDQAVGEVRCLGTGGQPDGQRPCGEVIDDCAAVVGVGDAVGDETFVQGQVGKRPILGQPVGGPVGGPTPLSVLYISHAAFSISRHAGGLEIGTSPEGALTASG
jgi:hypothetical protein